MFIVYLILTVFLTCMWITASGMLRPHRDCKVLAQPLFLQNEYIEEHIKRHGRRLDYFERKCVVGSENPYNSSTSLIFVQQAET